MSSIRLISDDVSRIQAAVSVLFSPLDGAEPGVWHSAPLNTLGTSFDADQDILVPVTQGREKIYVRVHLDQRAAEWPSEASLRERFGLSRQQARVALLLAERRTTAEIKEELCVSIYTARHHVEHVMAKLGVRSRRDVAALLYHSLT
ncbi:MAG TPA: helix-turn-helix transcriptional regulator [Rhodothermales bacterium]|nr:helix-turn-helix transcriptional regulator [Rhodothermales bacterium]